jgi:hypothetical protein
MLDRRGDRVAFGKRAASSPSGMPALPPPRAVHPPVSASSAPPGVTAAWANMAVRNLRHEEMKMGGRTAKAPL